ncbi:MAG: carboxypeptidase-like regulatory domain-containing protein, partial [Bacteroidota bacterium]
DLVKMFADAKVIFRGDAVKTKKFSFSSLLDVMSGKSGAGIKGLISNGQMPVSQIESLVISLQENGDEAYIDDAGNYRFTQLAAGTYSLLVEAEGYETQVIPAVVVNSGAFSIKNITLKPATPEPQPETVTESPN